jgi:hypothetical protein
VPQYHRTGRSLGHRTALYADVKGTLFNFGAENLLRIKFIECHFTDYVIETSLSHWKFSLRYEANILEAITVWIFSVRVSGH